MKTLDDANLAGQRVLVRVDINVPIKDGVVGDRTRIRAIVPTVKAILDAGGKPLLVAHLGRPKGSVVPELSLAPLQPVLTEELGAKVVFAGGITGADIETQTHALAAGEVLLLENVRFAAGEEANAPEFAAELAALADVYVNDAFSAAHRAHASTEGVAGHLPALAGRQMEAELTALSRALEQPERPTMAVVGGAKVSTKIDVLTHLVSKVDRLVVGGGMANTFLLALGHPIGRSLAEPDLVDTARTIMEAAKGASCDVLLPVDVVVAKEFAQNAANRVLSLHEVADDDMILDVGPVTIDQLKGHVDASRTILWNGPLGAFEIAPFGDGTFALAQHAAARTRDGHLVSVAGGGDTVAALNAAGVGDAFTYVSTAGGAFLEFLEGRELPGVAALMASKA